MGKHRTAADVLDQAADYLQQHGWAKGHLEEPTGEVCLIGSLNKVSGKTSVLYYKAEGALKESLVLDGLLNPAANYSAGNKTIAQINDHIFRTKTQAVTALRRAAKRARGEKATFRPYAAYMARKAS